MPCLVYHTVYSQNTISHHSPNMCSINCCSMQTADTDIFRVIFNFQEAYTCTALQIHPNDNVFLAQCNADYIAVFSQKIPYKLNKYKRFEGHRVSNNFFKLSRLMK